MKILGVLFLITLTVVVSALFSVYITLYVAEQKSNFQSLGRYQLIFGTIRHTTSVPSAGELGLITMSPSEQSVCFKFDTATGKTWRYISDFYQDPNVVAVTNGFERISADDEFPYTIRQTTNRKPEKKPIDFRPVE